MSYSSTVKLLNKSIEQGIRKELISHFIQFYGERVENHVNALLSLESHRGRFNYLQNKIGAQVYSSKQSILISGFSVGSEMIAAKELGFEEIFGVEVNPFYNEMCQKRVSHITGMHPQLYDGLHLPFDNEQFAVVASSHVIEHTQSPELYIQECMRVLIPDGYLLLEFPHRYHRTELHTGLFSFEWLPRPVRNAMLTVLSGRFFPLEKQKKKLYKQILITNLQQISMARIEGCLKKMAGPYFIVDKTEWKPGVLRCIIKKGHDEITLHTKRFKEYITWKPWRLQMDIYENRKSFLEKYINISNYHGIEIGPLDKPMIKKKDGSVKYVDYLPREELVRRHSTAVNPNEIVDIDYVISPRQKISIAIGERFDYFIACHVIEHIPNMIAWLEDIHAILNNHGYLFLAIPDKRYTFDILRSLTSLSHLLNDYHRNIEKADIEHVFEHIFLKRDINSSMVWNNKLGDKLSKLRFTASDAYARSLRELEPNKYPEVHCHVFTSTHFIEIIKTLIEMGILNYSICAFEDVKKPFNEFLVILQKSN